MKIFFLALLMITAIAGCEEGELSAREIKNKQQYNAEEFITALEKGETADAAASLDKDFYEKNKDAFQQLAMAFQQDYTTFRKEFKGPPTDHERAMVLVMPDGFNKFQFTYIDAKGMRLQMEISYSTDQKSKIVHLGMIRRASYVRTEGQQNTPKSDIEF